MKKLIYLFLILPFNLINGQSSWFFQHPFNTQNDILNIQILSSDTGYATGKDGTIIKITDRGYSWTNVNSNISEDIKSHWFLNSLTGYCITGTKLRKTIDGGINWTIKQTGSTDELLFVQFLNKDTGFVTCAYGKIYKTVNGGLSWSLKDLNIVYFVNTIFFVDNSIGYCSAGNFIYKTTDCGESWLIQNSNTFNGIQSIYFLNELYGFACGDNGLFLNTTNGGVNWESKNIQNDIHFYSTKFINSTTGYCAGNLWAGSGIFKTTNGGDNWLPQFVNSNDTLKTLWIFDSLNIIAAGNNGIVTRSTDTQHWSQISYLTNTGLNSIYFPSENTGYCVGDKSYDFINDFTHGFIMKTTNSGENWNVISTNNSCYYHDVYFLNDNTGYIVGDSTSSLGTIFKTTNGGENFHRLAFENRNIRKIVFLNDSIGFAGGRLIGGGGLIMGTTNSGNSWFDIKTFSNFSTVVSIFFIDDLNGYGVGNSGDFIGYIFKTTDGGKIWNITYNANVGVHSVFFINRSIGFVSGDQFILKTTDSGRNWSRRFFPLFRHLNSIYFTNSSTGYSVADNGKMLYTTNSGNSWIFQQSIVNEHLRSVFFTNPDNGYVAGYRGSIIKTKNGGIVNVEEDESIILKGFLLYQNYPNPFNPTTRINYEIKSSQFISLKVFDILGIEVSILVNEKQSPGKYSVNFNGTGLPSGIYFYRLSTTGGTGDILETRRMLLLK